MWNSASTGAPEACGHNGQWIRDKSAIYLHLVEVVSASDNKYVVISSRFYAYLAPQLSQSHPQARTGARCVCTYFVRSAMWPMFAASLATQIG